MIEEFDAIRGLNLLQTLTNAAALLLIGIFLEVALRLGKRWTLSKGYAWLPAVLNALAWQPLIWALLLGVVSPLLNLIEDSRGWQHGPELVQSLLLIEEVTRLTSGPGNEVFPSWSPDGQWIVFRAEVEDGGNHQLFVTTRNGQSVRRLFTSSYDDDWPAWSPDGQQIAFASDRDSPDSPSGGLKYAIYVYNLRTAQLERVTRGTRDARYPAWQPFPAP